VHEKKDYGGLEETGKELFLIRGQEMTIICPLSLSTPPLPSPPNQKGC